MPITGKELMRLLTLDNWTQGGRRNHGVFFSKVSPGERFPRKTVVPDKSDDLPKGTLGAILGVKETGLGEKGLQDLIEKYGKRP